MDYNDYNGALILPNKKIVFTSKSFSHAKLLDDLCHNINNSIDKKTFMSKCIRIMHFLNQFGIEYQDIECLKQSKNEILNTCLKLSNAKNQTYTIEKTGSIEYSQFNNIYDLIDYISDL